MNIHHIIGLRELADAMDADSYPGSAILRDAADEIERLRAELELAHTAAIASDDVITQLRATIRGLAAGDWEDDDE